MNSPIVTRLPAWSALAFLLTLFLTAPVGALQLASAPVTAVVTEFGRYALEQTEQRELAVDSTAGYQSVIDAQLLESGSEVPLRLGEVFGFRFAISDARRSDDWIPVEIHITHPPAEDHRGNLSRGYTMRSAARLGRDGRYHNGAYYLLNQPHELARGTWQIAVIYDGRPVVSRSFELR